MLTKKYLGSKTNKKNSSLKTRELWKSIPVPFKELKKKYQVSNMGRIRNNETGKILKSSLRSNYLSNSFMYEKTKKSYKVHRLVAKAFIFNDNPETKKWINHIDGNRMNNTVVNLEWCTPQENNEHAIKIGLRQVAKKTIIRYDPNEKSPNDVKIYDSILEASQDTGFDDGGICKACDPNNKKGYFCGYYWRYANEDLNRTTEVDLTKYKQLVDLPNYLINEEGKVYNLLYKKIMKSGNHSGGAGKQISLYNNGKTDNRLIHRLVAQYFLKKTNPKYNSIHHIDGDKSNNHVDNLEWCFVGGVEMLDSKYNTPYYNPKTVAILTQRKHYDNTDPKNLLTRNRKNLSKKQRIIYDKLKAELEKKKSKKELIEV